MNVRGTSLVLALATAGVVGCTEGPTHPSSTPTPPAPPAVTVAAPSPVEPAAGAISFGWPTLTVNNAAKTNTTNALEYRFDLSNREDFSLMIHSNTVPEGGGGQTSYTPPPTVTSPSEGVVFWRVIAVDRSSGVQSTASPVQSFAFYEDTFQSRTGLQLYGGLWTNVRPNGTPGKTGLGPGWSVGQRNSFDGVLFQSPPLEVLRIYDLLDHGYTPQGAIDWMHANGYPTVAVWYPSVACIGFPFQYMALIGGSWELVHRIGA